MSKNIDDEETEKLSTWKEFYEYFREYSEYSTIGGLVYIFMENQNWFGKLYWTITIISMFSLSTYWIVIIYENWLDQQTMTTIATTAEHIGEVPFPSVIICSQGYNSEVFFAGLFKMMFQNSGRTFVRVGNEELFPIDAAMIYKNYLATNAKDNVTMGLISFTQKNWDSFLQTSFPGLDPVSVTSLEYLGKILQIYSIPQIDSYLGALMMVEQMKNITADLVPDSLNRNSSLRINLQTKLNSAKTAIKSILSTLDTQSSFPNLLSALWYSKLPCFDVPGITYDNVGTSSILRNCWWKGKEIKCSLIFNQVPTDLGMCCAFNFMKAEEVYLKSEYTNIISILQLRDNMTSVNDKIDEYFISGEPKTQSGVYMGLLVMLDSHTDLMEPFSIPSDFNSFTAFIKAPGQYPFSNLRGVGVRKGHRTKVGLLATKVESDETVRQVLPDARHCYFTDEVDILNLHLNYTNEKCFMECTLAKAQSQYGNCTPWFLPFLDGHHTVCDPWTTRSLMNDMYNIRPEIDCKQCLPDCEHYIYKFSTTYEKIRDCDTTNLGSTYLCNLDLSQNLPKPQIWPKHILRVYEAIVAKAAEITDPNERAAVEYQLKTAFPQQELIQDSARQITSGVNLKNQYIFTKIQRTYDAYINDTAFLNVAFGEPTMLVYGTSQTQGWIIFFSNVGGILGLCIGFSVITVVELIWFMIVFITRDDQ